MIHINQRDPKPTPVPGEDDDEFFMPPQRTEEFVYRPGNELLPETD